MSEQGMGDDFVARRARARGKDRGSRVVWMVAAVVGSLCLLFGYAMYRNYQLSEAERARIHQAVAEFQQVPTGMPVQRPKEDGMLQVVYELRVNTARVATQLYHHRVAMTKLQLNTVLWSRNLTTVEDIAKGRERVAAAIQEERDLRGDVRAYIAADARAFDQLDAFGQGVAHNAFDPFATRVDSALDEFVDVEGEIHTKTLGVLDFAQAHIAQISEVDGHLQMPEPLLSEYMRMSTEIALLGTRDREVRYRLEELQAEATAMLNRWEIETR